MVGNRGSFRKASSSDVFSLQRAAFEAKLEALREETVCRKTTSNKKKKKFSFFFLRSIISIYKVFIWVYLFLVVVHISLGS